MSSPIADELLRRVDEQRPVAKSPMLRGWICPVCGAGVAPWKTEHCTPERAERA